MTFSDSRIAKLVRATFIPVWESVAPVRVATFDLGEGKVVKGTVGGEIAIYFCRPDGKAFDILPALHSPKATLWAMEQALQFYLETGATDEWIVKYHRKKRLEMHYSGRGVETPEIARAKKNLDIRKSASDPSTRDLGVMSHSKWGGIITPEPMVVVEPGGLDYYMRKIHEAMCTSEPKTPQEWKTHVFENVLEYELKGGEVRYGPDSLAPLSITEFD